MSNILIINAKKQFGHSNGELNQTLSDVAESFLRDLQHEVQVTV
ncbi:NADPH quinone reductase MdaB, partial [Serratia marcescens]